MRRRVREIQPDDSLLEALYNAAAALVFPSRFEGFGWVPFNPTPASADVAASQAALP